MIRIIVAEDHKLVRRSILSLLDASTDIEVVGEAENGKDAVALVEQLKPDLVIMDISMPHMDGIKATNRIQELDLPTRVLILSMHDNQALVQQALITGAHGYVLKRKLSTDLLPAIKQVKRGKVFLSRGLLDVSGKATL